jgi:sRNA-binding protein
MGAAPCVLLDNVNSRVLSSDTLASVLTERVKQAEAQTKKQARAAIYSWQNAQRIIKLLAKKFPQTFVAEAWMPHRPIALGIHQQLIDMGVITGPESRALHVYTTRLRYLAAMIEGTPRIVVTAEHAQSQSPRWRVYSCAARSKHRRPQRLPAPRPRKLDVPHALPRSLSPRPRLLQSRPHHHRRTAGTYLEAGDGVGILRATRLGASERRFGPRTMSDQSPDPGGFPTIAAALSASPQREA